MNSKISEQLHPVVERGLVWLCKGKRSFRHAQYIVSIEGPTKAAEEKARTSLQFLRGAMDLLEDTEHFEEAHKQLDLAGAFIRRTFGCRLHQSNSGSYEQRCPAALGHLRAGTSLGIIIRASECSICQQDPETCPHIKGRWYDGKFCSRRIKKFEVFEVALVSKPVDPHARIQSFPIGSKQLRERLGPQFKPGMPVNCDICLKPCEGFIELPAKAGRKDE
jgi:hypothetical protein